MRVLVVEDEKLLSQQLAASLADAGYAVDCAIERLRSLGVTNAMVKAGGDLRVLGAPPGKTNWTVQLEDPRKAGQRSGIPLRDAARPRYSVRRGLAAGSLALQQC